MEITGPNEEPGNLAYDCVSYACEGLYVLVKRQKASVEVFGNDKRWQYWAIFFPTMYTYASFCFLQKENIT